VAVCQSGSCSLSSLKKWKVNGRYWWDMLLSQQQMLAFIKHSVDDNIIAFQQHSSCMHQCMLRAIQFNSCCAKLSTSFYLSYGPNRSELNRLQDLGVYSSVNVSCKSTKLKNSSSDWSNSGKAIIERLSEKMRFSCSYCWPHKDQNNIIIERGNTVRDLGVIFDETFLPKYQNRLWCKSKL